MTTYKKSHKRISVAVRISPTLHNQLKNYERNNHCQNFTQAMEEVLHFGLSKIHEIDKKHDQKVAK